MKKILNNQYKNLEENMVSYKDLLSVSIKNNNEPFVKLDPAIIPNGYMATMDDMETITGKQVLVRETVAKKLIQAQKKLKAINPKYTLYVTYGYRSLEVQTKKFLEQLNVTTKKYFPDPLLLYEEVHRFIAVPTIAGHPTGGAIDVMIKDEETNKFLDFGSVQYDYTTKDCYVFADHISAEAKKNRMLLRNLLIEFGFAPFDGEWWHFSYGDKEWAYYYKKDAALYNQVEVSKLLFSN